MIGVVDYEAGNIASVRNALSTLEAEFIISSNAGELSRCSGIVLPGVGAATGAMRSLRKQGLTDFLRSVRVPLIGICLGMQILYEHSAEGDTRCLGILPGTIKKLNISAEKIPHMGWNRVEIMTPHLLMNGIRSNDFFYFAHSYIAPVDDSTVGITASGERFAAVVAKENYFGVQFHPEKSGASGLHLLRNFIELCSSFRQ
ncbi:MAG TPA: imidazole glycerol phosphate synthase subunit HisH [Bacteroidota bacterium]|nr:imidazole glycerol phosphate synthase subunit HisH [Bacteroidota bacterium]